MPAGTARRRTRTLRAEELGVERAVCLFDEDRNRLVCWYTGTPAPGEVRGCLKERVPAYMIPSKIFRTEEMPLNKNGKIDRAFFRAQLHK